ncbi:MAG: hypothetical protein IT373_01465 [Polyangiaceae bacterium]|nr:hypothetical protein [Polyangiaceae bacterium]
MPLIRIETSPPLEAATARALAARMSRVAAETLGKPEHYVMVVVKGATYIHMSGQAGPAAFVDVRSIGGLNDAATDALCRELAAALGELAAIPAERVFSTYTEVEARSWGHGSDVLG